MCTHVPVTVRCAAVTITENIKLVETINSLYMTNGSPRFTICEV